jgi:hypothetical protein
LQNIWKYDQNFENVPKILKISTFWKILICSNVLKIPKYFENFQLYKIWPKKLNTCPKILKT